MIIELRDPWHEPGFRVDTKIAFGRETEPMLAAVGDVIDIPETIPTVAIGDLSETPDPVTRLRPSDRVTGSYIRDGFAADGVPRYVWEPAR